MLVPKFSDQDLDMQNKRHWNIHEMFNLEKNRANDPLPWALEDSKQRPQTTNAMFWETVDSHKKRLPPKFETMRNVVV